MRTSLETGSFPSPRMADVFIRIEGTQRETYIQQKGRQRLGGGAFTSQGMPRMAGNLWKQESKWSRSSLEPQEGTNPADTLLLEFQLPEL